MRIKVEPMIQPIANFLFMPEELLYEDEPDWEKLEEFRKSFKESMEEIGIKWKMPNLGIHNMDK